MDFSEIPEGEDDTADHVLQTVPITRRVVAAGAIVITCGALVQAARGLVASGATASSKATDAVADSHMQPAASPTAMTLVIIENFTFSPEVLTVPVGTEVTWENHDDIPHTVTSEDTTTFASSLLDTGDRFSFRFTAPGTYPYFCSVHPMMTAKVVVGS